MIEEQMGEVIVTMNSKKQVQGITTIAPEVIRKIPGITLGLKIF
jgi:hypothetical protein